MDRNHKKDAHRLARETGLPYTLCLRIAGEARALGSSTGIHYREALQRVLASHLENRQED